MIKLLILRFDRKKKTIIPNNDIIFKNKQLPKNKTESLIGKPPPKLILLDVHGQLYGKIKTINPNIKKKNLYFLKNKNNSLNLNSMKGIEYIKKTEVTQKKFM